jgi:hypothetical protein
MIQKIWQIIGSWFVQPFPDYYPQECFECNEGHCKGCEIFDEWKD